MSVRHAILLVSRHPSLGTFGSNNSDDWAHFVAPVSRQILRCTHRQQKGNGRWKTAASTV